MSNHKLRKSEAFSGSFCKTNRYANYSVVNLSLIKRTDNRKIEKIANILRHVYKIFLNYMNIEQLYWLFCFFSGRSLAENFCCIFLSPLEGCLCLLVKILWKIKSVPLSKLSYFLLLLPTGVKHARKNWGVGGGGRVKSSEFSRGKTDIFERHAAATWFEPPRLMILINMYSKSAVSQTGSNFESHVAHGWPIREHRLYGVCSTSLRNLYLRCDMSTNPKIFSSRSCYFFTKK
jgi:hypothetical protein